MYNEIIIKIKATPCADLTAGGVACFLCDTASFLREKWYNKNNKYF